MNGMASGYLNSTPFDAFMLAITIKIIRRSIRIAIIGNPIMMKHKGIVRIMYRRIDSWKLRDALPFSFTHVDSSLFDAHITSGPITPPKGIKKQANAEIWQNIAQLRSVSDKTLISFMIYPFIIKTGGN
jgi:hypothetical protein